ncbi:hypothetical protein KCP73_19690 [Salmonella enterica subsp. enterica]|nr:hypothetical protein KCP73_19690 [Salmonella enterica subsp. enterica]
MRLTCRNGYTNWYGLGIADKEDIADDDWLKVAAAAEARASAAFSWQLPPAIPPPLTPSTGDLAWPS